DRVRPSSARTGGVRARRSARGALGRRPRAGLLLNGGRARAGGGALATARPISSGRATEASAPRECSVQSGQASRYNSRLSPNYLNALRVAACLAAIRDLVQGAIEKELSA